MNKHSPSHFGHQAFTLVELLAVTGVMAILAGLLLPAVNGMTQRARGSDCVSNLRQLGLGMAAFEQDNNGSLPYASEIDMFTGGQQNTCAAGICAEYLSVSKVSVTSGKLACPVANWPGYDPAINPRKYSANYLAYGYNPALGLPNFINAKNSSPRVRLAQISRPAEVIALADGGQASDGTTRYFIDESPYGTAQGDPANATQPISASGFQGSGLAAGQLYFEGRHNGYGNCLFVDGHVEARQATQIYQKNIYCNY